MNGIKERYKKISNKKHLLMRLKEAERKEDWYKWKKLL